MANEDVAIKRFQGMPWETAKFFFPNAYCYIEYQQWVIEQFGKYKDENDKEQTFVKGHWETKVDSHHYDNPTTAFVCAKAKYAHFKVIKCSGLQESGIKFHNVIYG